MFGREPGHGDRRRGVCATMAIIAARYCAISDGMSLGQIRVLS